LDIFVQNLYHGKSRFYLWKHVFGSIKLVVGFAMIFETIQMAFKVADDGHMLAKKKNGAKRNLQVTSSSKNVFIVSVRGFVDFVLT
jgi:hypothetical protein